MKLLYASLLETSFGLMGRMSVVFGLISLYSGMLCCLAWKRMNVSKLMMVTAESIREEWSAQEDCVTCRRQRLCNKESVIDKKHATKDTKIGDVWRKLGGTTFFIMVRPFDSLLSYSSLVSTLVKSYLNAATGILHTVIIKVFRHVLYPTTIHYCIQTSYQLAPSSTTFFFSNDAWQKIASDAIQTNSRRFDRWLSQVKDVDTNNKHTQVLHQATKQPTNQPH